MCIIAYTQATEKDVPTARIKSLSSLLKLHSVQALQKALQKFAAKGAKAVKLYQQVSAAAQVCLKRLSFAQ